MKEMHASPLLGLIMVADQPHIKNLLLPTYLLMS